MRRICTLSVIALLLLAGCSGFERVLEEIFPSSENMFSYRAIYQARNTDEVIAWIERFTDGLEKLFRERNQDYRLKTVQRIQAYINENITGNLDLGSVSSVFGYSRNYLSSLFTKYASTSFVDYVNSARMERAKRCLRTLMRSYTRLLPPSGMTHRSIFLKYSRKSRE